MIVDRKEDKPAHDGQTLHNVGPNAVNGDVGIESAPSKFLPISQLSTPAHYGVNSLDLPAVALVKWLLGPVVVTSVLMIAASLYGQVLDHTYIILAIVSFLVTAQIFDEINLYRSFNHFPIVTALNYVLLKWALVVFTLLLILYATKLSGVFPREVILTWVLVTPAALLLCQATARAILRKAVNQTVARRAVIIGGTQLGADLYRKIAGDAYLGIQVVGFFDERKVTRLAKETGEKTLGKISDAAQFVREQGIDLVYITLPINLRHRLESLLDELHDTTASVYFVPDIYLFDLIQARFDHINGVPIVAIRDTPFIGIHGLTKRISDILLSCCILVLSSPLMLLIGLMIKLESRGPVFFTQRRYGLDGEEINVYKFRSMTVCEDGDHVTQAVPNDKRVTRIGQFLRKSSLDELPQFVNVIQGRMSIVGPRPHAVAHNEMYRKVIKGYMIRHKVKPGITGWAQINGLRGETDTLDKMRKRIEYDLDYIRHWSLPLDLRIIANTVRIAFWDKQAY